jgi:hypothetical protein
MKKQLRLFAFACSMVVGSIFQQVEAASLIPFGNLTIDPNTGLEWLNLNLTAGQSYNSVLNGWGDYTTTGGFRFATRSEVVQLFIDAGASYIGFPASPNTADLPAATLTLSLLGTTLAQPGESRSWMFYDPSTEPELPSSAYVPSAAIGVGPFIAGYPDEGLFMVPGIFAGTDYASPEMAGALVRLVPEPSTAMLLTACIGLGLIVNKRRTSSSSVTRTIVPASPTIDARSALEIPNRD